MRPTITAYDWVPDFAKGQVRDLRVRWALEEVGRPYDVRYLPQGSQKKPEHRAIQPYGQVPTYEDGEVTLFESGAIVLHIAEARGKLLPEDQAARARAIEWMFAALNTVELPVADYATATLFERGEPWSKQRLPAVEKRVRERFAETAARLGDAEWFESGFSVGDLMMIAVLRNMRGTGLLAEHPTLAAYVDRGEARPAFQKALADQMAGFTGSPPPGFAEWQKKQQAGETA